MILLDVNVLLAAHRADHPHHGVARPWFDDMLAGEDRFAIPDVVWASFVRISTNRRIFEVPTPLPDVFSFLRTLRSHPNHVAISSGEDHLTIFEDLCARFDAEGDLAADAYIAAIAVEQGATLATFDRDFARFEGLPCVRPGAS